MVSGKVSASLHALPRVNNMQSCMHAPGMSMASGLDLHDPDSSLDYRYNVPSSPHQRADTPMSPRKVWVSPQEKLWRQVATWTPKSGENTCAMLESRLQCISITSACLAFSDRSHSLNLIGSTQPSKEVKYDGLVAHQHCTSCSCSTAALTCNTAASSNTNSCNTTTLVKKWFKLMVRSAGESPVSCAP